MSETKNLKLFKHDNVTTNTNQFDIDKALNQNLDKLDEAIGQDRADILRNAENIKKNVESISSLEQSTAESIEKLKAENEALKSQIPVRTKKRRKRTLNGLW